MSLSTKYGRTVSSYKWSDDFIDNEYYSGFNCFKTQEEAQAELTLTQEWRKLRNKKNGTKTRKN